MAGPNYARLTCKVSQKWFQTKDEVRRWRIVKYETSQEGTRPVHYVQEVLSNEYSMEMGNYNIKGGGVK